MTLRALAVDPSKADRRKELRIPEVHLVSEELLILDLRGGRWRSDLRWSRRDRVIHCFGISSER